MRNLGNTLPVGMSLDDLARQSNTDPREFKVNLALECQCEVCDEYYNFTDSDSDNPKAFCSRDCQLEREDKVRALSDPELLLDHDFTMNF